jgi:hypothetical protein
MRLVAPLNETTNEKLTLLANCGNSNRRVNQSDLEIPLDTTRLHRRVAATLGENEALRHQLCKSWPTPSELST